MKRPIGLMTLLVALACGVLLWWSGAKPLPPPSQSTSARSESAPRQAMRSMEKLAAAAMEHGTGPVSLEGGRYAIEFHNEFMPAAQSDGEPGLLLGFSAVLTIVPVGTNEGEHWSQFRISELTPLVDSAARNWLEGPEKEHLLRGLEQTFYLGTDAEGRAQKLKLTTEADALIEGILRLIAESTQFARGKQGDFEVEELDPVGEAQVSYRGAGPHTYRKRKLKYLRLLTDQGLVAPEQAGLQVDVAGETRVVRDARTSDLVELALEEDVSTNFGDAALTNHVELSLRLLERVPSGPAQLAFRRDKARPNIDLRRLPMARQLDAEQKLRELLEGKSIADLLAAGRSMDGQDTAGQRTLLAQLEASLTLEPNGAEEVARALRKAEEREASLLLSALGNAETPAAQRALGSIATDHDLDPEKRESAFALLGMSESPTPETLETVREVTRDPKHPNHRTAMLALGNLTKRLGDSEEADSAFDDLVRALQQASSESELVLCLSALGNTGDKRLAKTVQPYLERGSTTVRAEALWALRLVGNDEAFGLLARSATMDAEALVRQRAIEALRYRPHTESAKVLATSATGDPEAEVRLSALVALSALGDPSARELARIVAERDPSELVREQAARMADEG